MFPLRDVIPSRTTPYVTYALIFLNTTAFLLWWMLPLRQRDAVLYVYGLIPSAFSVPRLIASMFLHASWGHVIGNMWPLWIFGDNVEDRLGHGRFLAFYFVAGAVAACTQTWLWPTSNLPIVGASGAIAGVMGAYFVLFPKSRIQVLVWLVVFIDIIEVPAIFFLGFWFLLQMFSGLGSLADPGPIAFWSHLGGFLTGLLLVKLLERPERRGVEWWG